jgi:hypothetical protein
MLKPTDTAGMLLASLQSAYGRVVTGITYKGTLLNDRSALMRHIFSLKSTTAGFKVQVWSEQQMYLRSTYSSSSFRL